MLVSACYCYRLLCRLLATMQSHTTLQCLPEWYVTGYTLPFPIALHLTDYVFIGIRTPTSQTSRDHPNHYATTINIPIFSFIDSSHFIAYDEFLNPKLFTKQANLQLDTSPCYLPLLLLVPRISPR